MFVNRVLLVKRKRFLGKNQKGESLLKIRPVVLKALPLMLKSPFPKLMPPSPLLKLSLCSLGSVGILLVP